MAVQRGPAYSEVKGKGNGMPLHKGKGKKVQEENFHELKQAHPDMPNKQRVAIVLNTARSSGASIPHGSHHKRHREHR